MLEKMTFLSAAENRQTFFYRISLLFPRLDYRYKAIERAYDYAKDAFRGIEREAGERYFEHIRAVCLILIDYLRIKDYELIIAALLHDIVEDIPSWRIERVQSEFGEEVALLVEYLTKPPESPNVSKQQSDKIYHDRFKFAPRRFFLIKLSDRLHNLITLWACSAEKRARKIQETKLYYMSFAERELILLHELEEAISNLETKPCPSPKPKSKSKKTKVVDFVKKVSISA